MVMGIFEIFFISKGVVGYEVLVDVSVAMLSTVSHLSLGFFEYYVP